MRGASAKRLRRLAHETTVGVPWRSYVQDQKTKQVMLKPGCGRWVYQQSKRVPA